jgi:hypothetical protein
MRRMLAWAGAAVLATALTLGGQTQGQNAPRGSDKDGDGKCDVCGRPASQIGRQGRGPGRGRGFRNGCCMRAQNCGCPGCQAAQQQSQPKPESKN